jgi:hypothetical protein
MAVLLTRRCSAGRFGGTEGVVKFRGEEVGFNKYFNYFFEYFEYFQL